MAYEIKYRAECNTVRQNKAIKVDILEDGANPISSITNSVISGYDTFTTTGTQITSAIWDGSGSPVIAESDTFSMVANTTYIVSFTLTLNSGQAPTFDFTGVTVDSVQSASGANNLEFTPTTSFATATLSIFNDGATNYSTSAIYIFEKTTFGLSPVVISQFPPDDPFEGGIVGSEARIHLISKTSLQFSEFFTCKERDYRVMVYFGGTNVWNGYITSEMYSEPYVDPPYEIELVAYDGIGDLRNIPYEQTGEETVKDVIENAIQDYLDVGWNWYDYVLDNQTGFGATGFYETSENGSDANNVTLSEDRFVPDSIEEYSSVYDVLDSICKTFDARFMMDRGYWRWYRPIAQRNTAHEYYYWDKGAGSEAGDEDNQKAITAPDAATPCCWVDGSQMLNILPAYREFYLVHDYGFRHLLWKDFSFEFSDITTYWEDQASGLGLAAANRVGREMELIFESGGFKPLGATGDKRGTLGDYYTQWIWDKNNIKTVATYKFLPGSYCIDMETGDTTVASLLSSARVHYKETFTIQNTAAANYGINVKWDQKVDFTNSANTTLYIRAYNASDDKWLDETGAWVAGPENIGFNVESALQWETFEVTSAELNTSYEYTIHVYLSSAEETGAGSVTGTWFDNILISVVRLHTDPMAVEKDASYEINTDHNIYHNFPVRVLGDVNEQGYEDTIYKGYLKVYDGAAGTQLSQTWQIGGSRHQTLIEHSRDMHRCLRETPRWKLTGTVYGDNNFMTAYTDAGKVFFTNYASWDLQEMTWQGEFIEIPAASVETTNLITGWTNSGTFPFDTLTSTDAVIDSAIESTGNKGQASTNSISFTEGEQFYMTWSFTENSGDFYLKTFFAGDYASLTTETGSATLTATSTASGSLLLYLDDTYVGNYSDVTICLYRKYGY